MIDDGYRFARALAAFIEEHRRCGDLKTGMTQGEPTRVWVACSCGARIEQNA
jgi:hypothetical protein